MDPNWSKLFQTGLKWSKWDNYVLINPNGFKCVHRVQNIMNSIGWPLKPGLLGPVSHQSEAGVFQRVLSFDKMPSPWHCQLGKL